MSPYDLTELEQQVGAQLLAGRRGYEIANAMQISILSVELHRARLMTKLGARNLAHLIHLLGTIQLPHVNDIVYLDDLRSSFAF